MSIHEETGKSKDQASEESRAVTPQSGAPEETMGEGRGLYSDRHLNTFNAEPLKYFLFHCLPCWESEFVL